MLQADSARGHSLGGILQKAEPISLGTLIADVERFQYNIGGACSLVQS